MWNLKRNYSSEFTYKIEKILTDFENKLRIVGRRDSLGIWDGQVHTAI